MALEAYNRLLGLERKSNPRRVDLAAVLARAKRPPVMAAEGSDANLQPVPKPKRLRLAAYEQRPAPPVARLHTAPRPLADYAGRYRHPAYGEIEILPSPNGLAGRMHGFSFVLLHERGDAWSLPETVWPLREGLTVTFLSDAKGKIDRLATPLADGPSYGFNPGEMIFVRQP